MNFFEDQNQRQNEKKFSDIYYTQKNQITQRDKQRRVSKKNRGVSKNIDLKLEQTPFQADFNLFQPSPVKLKSSKRDLNDSPGLLNARLLNSSFLKIENSKEDMLFEENQLQDQKRILTQMKPTELISSDASSDKFSAKAVIDGQNLIQDTIQHQTVKGFRQFNKNEENAQVKSAIGEQKYWQDMSDKRENEKKQVSNLDDIFGSIVGIKNQKIFKQNRDQDNQKPKKVKTQNQTVNEILKDKGISKDIQFAEDLLLYIEKVQEASLNDKQAVKQYLLQKGVFQMEELHEKNLKNCSNSFENQTEVEIIAQKIRHINGEKLVMNHEHNFKEWEQYDILSQIQYKNQYKIQIEDNSYIPEYLKEDLKNNPELFKVIDFSNAIIEIKCGQKVGQNLNSLDSKWSEKWYEIKLNRTGSLEFTIKFFSKFWTNIQNNRIEGESLLQILNKSNLAYELKDFYNIDNILNKEEPLIHENFQSFGQPLNSQIEKEQTNDVFFVPQKNPPILSSQKKETSRSFLDEYHHNKLPMHQRDLKIYFLRAYITEFDKDCRKVFEEGVEHEWTTLKSSVIKTGVWKTQFTDKCVSLKKITFKETDLKLASQQDPNVEHGLSEGINENGIFWKEEWSFNQKTQLRRWSTMFVEQEHQRQDGFLFKWGEWQEEQPGDYKIVENWTEKLKKDEDYWEKKSDRYKIYARQQMNDFDDNQLDKVLNSSNPLRTGLSDFSNNRNYIYSEKWEEYLDGTHLKKFILDDGFGKKTLTEQNQKLNLDLLENIQFKNDENGYFLYFLEVGKDGKTFQSLQELINNHQNFIEWKYENQTIDDIPNASILELKQGVNNKNNEVWNFKMYSKPIDKYQEVHNEASDSNSKWLETWSRKNLERWAYKEGNRSGQYWKESWYKKVKELSKKKDENGDIIKNPETGSDQYESDGDEIEESNCEKWGRNEETQEEWNEKWGEVHRPNQKQKWCDKWQIDLTTGQKKGENWGQNYTEDYQIKEHWAEKWDDRHQENGGVYEKRHEAFQ